MVRLPLRDDAGQPGGQAVDLLGPQGTGPGPRTGGAPSLGIFHAPPRPPALLEGRGAAPHLAAFALGHGRDPRRRCRRHPSRRGGDRPGGRRRSCRRRRRCPRYPGGGGRCRLAPCRGVGRAPGLGARSAAGAICPRHACQDPLQRIGDQHRPPPTVAVDEHGRFVRTRRFVPRREVAVGIAVAAGADRSNPPQHAGAGGRCHQPLAGSGARGRDEPGHGPGIPGPWIRLEEGVGIAGRRVQEQLPRPGSVDRLPRMGVEHRDPEDVVHAGQGSPIVGEVEGAAGLHPAAQPVPRPVGETVAPGYAGQDQEPVGGPVVVGTNQRHR